MDVILQNVQWRDWRRDGQWRKSTICQTMVTRGRHRLQITIYSVPPKPSEEERLLYRKAAAMLARYRRGNKTMREKGQSQWTENRPRWPLSWARLVELQTWARRRTVVSVHVEKQEWNGEERSGEYHLMSSLGVYCSRQHSLGSLAVTCQQLQLKNWIEWKNKNISRMGAVHLE